MAVTPGDRRGPYEILARIGAGGMGEVWRARDTRLGREVAIKISGEQFSDRFEREARAVAALNHPNICTLHDVGPDYLVMELVDGATLAERIRQGPIPVGEALALARQIAEALDAAHEKGIVHRDLKPANIKVKPDGSVKVLDFGLAKMAEPAAANTDLENSPTLTLEQATRVGLVVGTAAYMAPEQARGKSVDKRADIWAFGVVLHEMMTGHRLFEGETVSDTLAHVITKEPVLDGIPGRARGLVRRCLEKDPKKRLRDIGDAMALLEESAGPEAAPVSAGPAPRWLWPVTAAALLATAALAVMRVREKPPAPPQAARFQIRLPDQVRFTGGTFTLSPDGRHVAFSAIGPGQPPGVWVQDLDALEARLLPGTFTGNQPPPFFWSPDSRFVAYSENSPKLRKADLTGGPIQDISEKPSPPVGGSWNRDGTIIFGSTNSGLWRVPAAGGKPVPLTTLDTSRHERQHQLPSFLPDGHHFLYLRTSKTPEESGIYVGSLDDAPDRQNKMRLVATEFGPVFVPPSDNGPGKLLFLQDGTLMAQAFDAGSLKLSGNAMPIAERIGSVFQTGFFSATPNTLVYRASPTPRDFQLAWYDAQGKPTGEKVGDPGSISQLRLSPDGSRLAYRIEAPNPANADIWLLDLARGASSRFTFGPNVAGFPVWSPDGTEIVFASNRDGIFDLYRKPANGAKEEEPLLRTKENKRPASWSPDGRFLLYTTSDTSTFSTEDIWVLPMQGDRTPIPFLRTAFDEGGATFSPDGRWVAYYSNEAGRYQVYVREFVPPPAPSTAGGKWMVSKDGGANPRWRADGKELIFTSVVPPRSLLSVGVDTSHVFTAGVPRELFRLPNPINGIATSEDFKRFLFNVALEQKTPESFTVMLNWNQ